MDRDEDSSCVLLGHHDKKTIVGPAPPCSCTPTNGCVYEQRARAVPTSTDSPLDNIRCIHYHLMQIVFIFVSQFCEWLTKYNTRLFHTAKKYMSRCFLTTKIVSQPPLRYFVLFNVSVFLSVRQLGILFGTQLYNHYLPPP